MVASLVPSQIVPLAKPLSELTGTELRSERDACEICADALVRRAVAAMDPRSFEYLGEILQRELQAAALVPRKIPFALCRDAIRAMTRNVWLIRTNDLKELPPLDGVA